MTGKFLSFFICMGNGALKPDKEPDICAICMQYLGTTCRQDDVCMETGFSSLYNPPVPSLCGHHFHRKCIHAYLAGRPSGLPCPMCRKEGGLSYEYFGYTFHCQHYHCAEPFFVIYYLHYRRPDTHIVGWNYGKPPRDLLNKYNVLSTSNEEEEEVSNRFMETLLRDKVHPNTYNLEN